MVRPAAAAAARAAAICSVVRAFDDSTSQPARAGTQPCRRIALWVTSELGAEV